MSVADLAQDNGATSNETKVQVTAQLVESIIRESTQIEGFCFTAYYPQLQMQVTCVLKEDWLISNVVVDYSPKNPEISFIGKKNGQSAIKFAVRGKEFVAAAEKWFAQTEKARRKNKGKSSGLAVPVSIVFSAGVTELF